EGPQRLRRRLELDLQAMRAPRFERSEATGKWAPIRSSFVRSKLDKRGGWEVKEDMLEPEPMTAVLPATRGAGGKGEAAKGGMSSQLASTLQLANTDDLWRMLGVGNDDEGNAACEVRVDKFQWALELGDPIVAIYNCARLSCGTPVPGVLLVCGRNLYLFDHCLVEPSGEVSIQGRPGGPADPGEGGRAGGGAVGEDTSVRRWAYWSIRDIQRRRYLLRPVGMGLFATDGSNCLLILYLLRPVGMELFATDGSDCLLIFHKSERQAVFDHIWAARTEALAKIARQGPGGGAERESSAANPPEKRLGQAHAAAVGEGVTVDLTDPTQTSELAAGKWTGRASAKTLLKNLRRRWEHRKISNLQYLIHLNTLAGRSYNDLTQYPVFPWVLSDYTSETLDLSDPSVYRDLSKPMGAQDPKRAEQYKKRFVEWVEPDEERPTPRFHYATHYSSAAYVTFFLLRLEPFTSAHVQLQGGKFDHADRLFSSVAETWQSASRGSLADVKELTPEFYYMPDFLLNVNSLDLGSGRSGTSLGDVELPPWAHGSADEFVRKMRQALESEHVSAHLHEWVDLIFGFRQHGPAAEEALNVFHHLTYEGAVDVDAITDPVERMSTVAQILNFGQTPTQLFDKPHPPRGPASDAGAPRTRVRLCVDPCALETERAPA
ncbi:BEACH domain-containing protein, partial [Baffinella frigidus]